VNGCVPLAIVQRYRRVRSSKFRTPVNSVSAQVRKFLKIVPRKFVPRRLEPFIIAPVKSASIKFAPLKLVTLRLALINLLFEEFDQVKFAISFI